MSVIVGQIVISLAGHDKGRLYLVVGEEERCVLLCDGRYHRLTRPKRKNRKHILPLSVSGVEDVTSLTDGALRRLLRGCGEETTVS